MATDFNFEGIENINFSEADLAFIEEVTNRNEELLEGFVILFGIANLISIDPDVRIKGGKDLVQYLDNRVNDIQGDDWVDFFGGTYKIMSSKMIQDIQIHMVQKKPKGQAKKFFQTWLDYYTEFRNQL